MAVPWKSTLPLILLCSLLIFDEWLTSPSCRVVPATNPDEIGLQVDEEELKVMMVANLLLLGSESSLLDVYFRDYYMAKFFRKSLEKLNPDMLIALGDVSARGLELTKTKWISVINQFERMLGPFLNLPFHVLLGDRDIGECSGLKTRSVGWIAGNFPGLDSAGCGAFEISNVTFVTLNTVALLCGNNDLRFSVEKVIERESLDFQMEVADQREAVDGLRERRDISYDFDWRENSMSSGSGPVLLLHFPLHQTVNDSCYGYDCNQQAWNSSFKDSHQLKSSFFRRFVGTGPYGLLHTLPPNATEYIFQALRPRIVFSAHNHEFSDRIHEDGTREITVPAMSWNAEGNPGFIMATFGKGRAPIISYCSLAKESHVIIYIIALVLMIPMLVANSSLLRSLLS